MVEAIRLSDQEGRARRIAEVFAAAGGPPVTLAPAVRE
jgi:hypothetical protein